LLSSVTHGVLNWLYLVLGLVIFWWSTG